jgi:hypothetical protein
MSLKVLSRWRRTVVLSIVLLVSLTALVSAFEAAVRIKVSTVVCDVYLNMKYIAMAVAALIMVIAGIKWTASENDPGARKAAKDAMVHTMVGLIIISIISDIIKVVNLGFLCP